MATNLALDDKLIEEARRIGRHATKFYNACRAKGVTGGGVDLLICSVARRLDVPIFTTDPDLESYARYLRVALFSS